METLLNTDEAAQFLRLAKNTLEVWRLRGTGPIFLKLGRRVLYRSADLERFTTEKERRSTSDNSGRH